MKIVSGILGILLFSLSLNSFAELTIEITEGVDDPTPIAISPFAWTGAGVLNESVSSIIENDLKFSGLFNILAKEDMLNHPSEPQDVLYRDWRSLGRQYLLIGSVEPVDDVNVKVKYYLYDVVRQQRIFGKKLVGSKAQLRDMAHKIADQTFEELTNVKGAFSTKILYVSAKVFGDGKYNYKLYQSDFDGERKNLVLNSAEPILSPTWSPDAKKIAYVSFESGRPAIFTQVLATGEREKLTNFKGMNSSPAFSPNGRQLAIVLSKDGSPDIYIVDLETKALRKVAADNFAIDTEPAWMPDGKSLVFTSNRGGKPQIYQVNLQSGDVQRVTFSGGYNAKAQPLADGSGFILVHQANGSFHIARFDRERDRVYVLTSTDLDESPSIAANGSMVMYAAKRGNKGVLAVVSVDGNVKTILPSTGTDDVRDPAWSPYIQ